MVTDMAPVDLVLQRAGRLHRHEKADDKPVARPAAVAEPRLWLAVPEVGPDGVPRSGPDEWVYERYVLLRSYLCLVSSGLSAVRIPEDLERLIERVYGGEEATLPGPAWSDALNGALADMRRKGGADTFEAESRLIPDPDAPDGLLEEFNLGLPDEDLANRWGFAGLTRKTRRSVTLVCLHQVAGRLYLDPGANVPVDLDHPPDPTTTTALLSQSAAVSRAAVVRHFRENQPEPPQAWRRVPILRHCRPLVLESGAHRIGTLTIRLDEDLGIVLEGPPAGPSEGD
jgi:CRISPR-associated endonuclease/helicase Cas3